MINVTSSGLASLLGDPPPRVVLPAPLPPPSPHRANSNACRPQRNANRISSANFAYLGERRKLGGSIDVGQYNTIGRK